MFKILFNPKRAERRPIEMMLIGIFYSSISIFLAAWIFPQYASLVMVFLTVMSCIYIIQGAIKIEETKDRRNKTEAWRLKEHSKLLVFLLFLFIGFVISFSFWSFVLPTPFVDNIFSAQAQAVDGVRSSITGNAIYTGNLSGIIFNNFKVLFFSLVFAFFYGAGAIFVLVWNASAMGFVIGTLAKTTLGVAGLPFAFAKYFIHGIPEMLSYLTIALAGGILYTAFWRGDFLKKERIKKILFDVFILVLVAILLLIASALIEIYVSPWI